MKKPNIRKAEEAVGLPFKDWKLKCHEVSLAIVKSNLIKGARRVARGWCKNVGS